MTKPENYVVRDYELPDGEVGQVVYYRGCKYVTMGEAIESWSNYMIRRCETYICNPQYVIDMRTNKTVATLSLEVNVTLTP